MGTVRENKLLLFLVKVESDAAGFSHVLSLSL